MTNQEYEQKRRECWEEFCKSDTPYDVEPAFDYAFDRAFALGKQAAELSSNSEQLNAEGEDEMLCVSRKEIQQLVDANDVVILEAAGIDNIETIQAKTVNTILNRLFGSKCLPDENSSIVEKLGKNEDAEPKPDGPKFHIGQYVRHKPTRLVDVIDGISQTAPYIYHFKHMVNPINGQGIFESDLEPYTEPGKEAQNPETSPETAGLWDAPMSGSGDATAVLNDFGGDRRLNIAAMAMQGILSNIDLFKNVLEAEMETLGGDDILYRAVAKASFLFADALVSEAEKGGVK